MSNSYWWCKGSKGYSYDVMLSRFNADSFVISQEVISIHNDLYGWTDEDDNPVWLEGKIWWYGLDGFRWMVVVTFDEGITLHMVEDGGKFYDSAIVACRDCRRELAKQMREYDEYFS